MLDIFAGVPAPEREKMLAIGRTMAAMNRKQMAAEGQIPSESAAIQARKDLAAMGLSYHDRNQFPDAVNRRDAIAVRSSRGPWCGPGRKGRLGQLRTELARRAATRRSSRSSPSAASR